MDLKEIMETQEDLQAKMGWPGGKGERGAKEMILAAVVELTEVLDEFNWKPWKPPVKEVDREATATEITDVLQFLANVALCLGFTAEDLEGALRQKWKVNLERYERGETTKADEDEEMRHE